MKYVYLDLETTGLSPDYSYILEIAAIYMVDGKESGCFHTYVNIGRSIPENITQLTGITNEMIQYSDSEDGCLHNFIDWCIGCIGLNNIDAFIGHNCNFDKRFLISRCKYHVISEPFNNGIWIDTMEQAKRLSKLGLIDAGRTPTGRPCVKQENLAKFFNIEYDAHTAIEDVKALIKIHSAMCALEGK